MHDEILSPKGNEIRRPRFKRGKGWPEEESPDGDEIHRLRSLLEWNEQELADKAGIGKKSIEQMEKGERTSITVLRLVAQALGVEVGQLLPAVKANRDGEQAASEAEKQDKCSPAAEGTSMKLPDVTHLQFLVLTFLLDGEQSGREIRAKLSKHGENKSGPAFYQMMARLEDAKFIEGWYDQKIIDAQIIKERRYRVTATGKSAWQAARDFYLRLASGTAAVGFAAT